MYDIPFSEGWMFDKCQEIASILGEKSLWIILYAIIAVWLFKRIQRKEFSPLKMTTLFLTSLLVWIVGIYLFIVALGFLYVHTLTNHCKVSRSYWPLLQPGIELNASLNHLYTYNHTLPRDQDELKKHFPEKYLRATERAKIKYIYSEIDNSYILSIRPSRYSIHMYSSSNGLNIYQLSKKSFLPNDTIEFFSDQSIYTNEVIPFE